MRITWGHLAGFLVISAAVFAFGVMRGKARVQHQLRERHIDRVTVPRDRPAPIRGLNKYELAFVDHVAPYPRSVGPEIPAGKHRDAFGLPMRVKKFDTLDSPTQVLAWYSDFFRMKNYKVYSVNDTQAADLARIAPNSMAAVAGMPGGNNLGGNAPPGCLGAIDVVRKNMYFVTAVQQQAKGDTMKTMVVAAWVDGSEASSRETRLVPLQMGETQPVMLSGDGRTNEMAIYMVDGSPNDAYDRYGSQLAGKGWKEVAPGGARGAAIKERQRSFVSGEQELMLTAKSHQGKTVLICLVTPRVG